MKRTILALLAGAGLALSVQADDKPATTATTSATPVVVTDSATPARRGLLARLRDRRGTTTMTTAPATVVTPSTPATTPPTTVPAPLPSVKPASGTTTVTDGVVTAAYTMPATPARTGLFSRMRNRSTTTAPMPMPTTMNAVVPAAGTVTMPTTSTPVMMEATPTTTRTGLMARLRARRG